MRFVDARVDFFVAFNFQSKMNFLNMATRRIFFDHPLHAAAISHMMIRGAGIIGADAIEYTRGMGADLG